MSKKETVAIRPPVDVVVKPRVNFCWHCGKKLYGNRHADITISAGDYDLPVICHVRCAEDIKNNGVNSRTYDNKYFDEV